MIKWFLGQIARVGTILKPYVILGISDNIVHLFVLQGEKPFFIADQSF